MKAVGLYKYLPIDHPESLIDIDVPKPKAEGRDLLVRIKAVAVNPVDTKLRAPKDKTEQSPKILGWDAAGIVEETGPDVSLFKKGDEVYYSGSIIRQGCNAEYQLVDERITGRKPSNLTFEEAAALPLTTITAWESMFEQMCIPCGDKDATAESSLLIIGGAGGVGSIAVQLAKQLSGLKVIATASRKETTDWCLKMGADYVINHHGDLAGELSKIGYKAVDYIFCLSTTESYFSKAAEIIKPFGRFCSIVGLKEGSTLDMNLLRSKSATFSWEFMFTKSSYQTSDIISQHNLLNKTAELAEADRIKTTMTENFGILNAESLRKAHRKIESGSAIGKIVLSVS